MAAVKVCFAEVGAARLGVGQVGGPRGVAHLDTTVIITVLAALGEHGQVGSLEACGLVLLGLLRLARRAPLGKEGALGEDG